VLSFRNPGEFAISVEVGLKWGFRIGERSFTPEQSVFIGRDAPSPDDRRVTLPSGGRHRMTFAMAFALDSETAEQHAWRWTGDGNASLTQATQYQGWFDERAPRLDCPDPWLMKLWYHRWYLVRRDKPPTVSMLDRRWLEGNIAAGSKDCGIWQEWRPLLAQYRIGLLRPIIASNYEQGDYDRPFLNRVSKPIIDLVVTGLLGLLPSDDGVLYLRPLIPIGDTQGWPYFCLENLSYQGHRLTIVWDDPNLSDDMYDDGDKGFTVYDGDTVVHHQSDLSPCAILLSRPRSEEDMDEDDL